MFRVSLRCPDGCRRAALRRVAPRCVAFCCLPFRSRAGSACACCLPCLHECDDNDCLSPLTSMLIDLFGWNGQFDALRDLSGS